MEVQAVLEGRAADRGGNRNPVWAGKCPVDRRSRTSCDLYMAGPFPRPILYPIGGNYEQMLVLGDTWREPSDSNRPSLGATVLPCAAQRPRSIPPVCNPCPRPL